MITFNSFRLLEDVSEATKVQQLRLELSQKFDELTDAKALKKDGDPASEIASLNKQSVIYAEISGIMKELSAEINKQKTTVVAPLPASTAT